MENYNPKHITKDSELQDILVESYKSTKVFAKVFFPERFYAPFSSLHDQIFELLDSDAPKVAIAAPRGIGKTSMVGLALSAKKILFQDSRFLPYVSKSFDSSLLQTENLKIELGSNKLIRQLFGLVKTTSGEVLDKTFSKKSWVARFQDDSHGTLIYPRGANQQIRGVLFHNARPDFFIFDDFEDSDEVLNDELREKLKVRFYADFMKAVSRIDKNWRMIYIDTLKHEDALLQGLLDSSDWESICLELCDDDLNSKAPEFISTEEIKKEYEAHKAAGLLDVFAREFRNLPISKEDAIFRPEFFKYYDECGDHLLIHGGGEKPEKVFASVLTNLVIVDPAKTVKLSSADSSVLVIGVDRSSKKIFLRNVIAGKMEPDELLNTMFEQVVAYKAMILAVETTGLDRWISQPIENEMRVRGVYPIYYSLSASGSKKDERIASLGPYYRLGYIYHNKSCCTKLENQLLMHPRSKLKDVADGLSHLMNVMDQFAYYFDPDDFEPESDEVDYKELYEGDESPLKFAVV